MHRIVMRPGVFSQFIIMLVLLGFLIGCTTVSVSLLPEAFGASAEKKLTLMIYMCGSDLESDGGAASADFDEMKEAMEEPGYDPDEMNLLIMAGGSSQWENSRLGTETGNVIIRDPSPGDWYHAATGEMRMKMSDPETLSWFLNFCTENYPAQEYALILWDHGGGPLIGVCQDNSIPAAEDKKPESSASGQNTIEEFLTLSELTDALGRSLFSENKLSWIGFDACLMSSLEIAASISPYADYMIASEEIEPEDAGWDYSFLANLLECKNGGDAGQLIVDRYSSQKANDADVLTLACLDLEKTEILRKNVDQLFEKLAGRLEAESFSPFYLARQSAADVGRVYTSSSLDLTDLLLFVSQFENQEPERVTAIREAFGRAVYYRGNQNRLSGVSLYSPRFNKADFSEKWKEDYRLLNVLPGYVRYIERYAEIWQGDQLADWSTLFYYAKPNPEDGTHSIELKLTNDQLSHFASAKVVILRETGGKDTYHQIYEIDNITRDKDTLKAQYAYDGLYVVNENGQAVTDSYSFKTEDGLYYVDALLEEKSLSDEIVQIYTQYAKEVSNLDSRKRRANINASIATFHGFDPPENLLSAVFPEYNAGEDKVVRLVLRRSENDPDEMEIVNIVFYDQTKRVQLGRQNRTFDSEKWPWISFVTQNFPLKLTRDDLGNVLPANHWATDLNFDFRTGDLLDENGEAIDFRSSQGEKKLATLSDKEANKLRYSGEFLTSGGWSLRFLHQQASGLNLFAQFIVTDTQGNEIASGLMPLENQNTKAVLPGSEVVLSDEEVEVRLTQMEVVNSGLDRGVILRFQVHNDSENIYRLQLNRLILNNTGMPDQVGSFQLISPVSDSNVYVRLPADLLPPVPDDVIHQISFVPELYQAGSYSLKGNKVGRRVTISPNLNISELNPNHAWDADAESFQGETVSEEILFRLTDLREEKNGILTGTLYLKNLSDRDQFLFMQQGIGIQSLSPVEVNGCYLQSTLESFIYTALPSGSDLFTEFHIRREPTIDSLGDSAYAARASTDLLNYWDIDEITEIGFYYEQLSGNDDQEITGIMHSVRIPLSVPMKLNSTTDPGSDFCPVLEGDHFQVGIRGICKRQKTIFFMMDIRNETDETVMVAPLGIFINAVEVPFKMESELDTIIKNAELAEIRARPNTRQRLLIMASLPWDFLSQPLEQADVYIGCENSVTPAFYQGSMLSLSILNEGEVTRYNYLLEESYKDPW